MYIIYIQYINTYKLKIKGKICLADISRDYKTLIVLIENKSYIMVFKLPNTSENNEIILKNQILPEDQIIFDNISISPTGEYVIAEKYDENICFLYDQTGHLLHRIPTNSKTIKFSWHLNRSFVLSVDSKGILYLWGHVTLYNNWSAFPPSFTQIDENVESDEVLVKPVVEDKEVIIKDIKIIQPNTLLLIQPE